jgi:putative SOS response-associated peptidase YedK
MCGRYVHPDTAAMERAWSRLRHPGLRFVRRFNVSPSQNVPVLVRDSDDGMSLSAARWGFVPHWWKQAEPPKHSINARSEDAAHKPLWRDAMRRSRCLLPAEGWYEWHTDEYADPGSGKIKSIKQPHYVHAQNGALLAFAGLLARWTPPDGGQAQVTCAILTRAAEGELAEIHERMPVVLAPMALGAWLDPRLDDGETAARLLQAHAMLALAHHPVSRRVNSPVNDGPELIEPSANERDSGQRQ